MINYLKGAVIGAANIIPGVSGGTFALILRIYTRLIDAVSQINLKLLKNICSDSRKGALRKADTFFLIQVIIGAVLGIAVFSWPLDYAMKNHPGYTLAFFSGLILLSIFYPLKMIKEKRFSYILYAAAGAAALIRISSMSVDSASEASHILIFFAGIIGISAMALPGLSGSAIMLVLGVYDPIIANIREFTSSFSLSATLFLSVFGLGCIAGLIIFVKLMKYLLHNARSKTLSVLIGMVLGSLYVLWPFKEYSFEGASLISGTNRLPYSLREAGFHIIFFLLGVLLVCGMTQLSRIGIIKEEIKNES